MEGVLGFRRFPFASSGLGFHSMSPLKRCPRTRGTRKGFVFFPLISQFIILNLIAFEMNDEYLGKTKIPAEATTSYAVTEVYPQAGHVYARLREIHWWENFDHYSKVQRNFIAEVTLVQPAAGQKEGRVSLGAIHEVATDEFHDHSIFFPIDGRNATVQRRNTWLFANTLFLCDGNRPPVQLATAIARPGADCGTFAVTRSGSTALAAWVDEVRIGDPANWSASVREEGPLADVRRELAARRGNAGTWFLTDDLRYIVVVPSRNAERYTHGVYIEGGTETSPGPILVNGMSFDLDKDILIYDRQNKKPTFRPRELAARRGEIIDVESVDGRLQRLYAYVDDIAKNDEVKELHREETLTVVDDSNQLLYEHRIVSLNTYALFGGWDPARRQLWFRIRDVPVRSINDDLPTETPEADYHLMVWDANSNSERQARLTVGEIKASIDTLPKN